MNKNPLISVIILSYNVPEDVIDCVRSIKRQTYKPIEILVVDNGSDERTVKLLKQKLSGVTFLWNSKNLGRTGGYNVGIKKVKGKSILLLDQDTIADKAMVAELQKTLASDPLIGAVGPLIVFYDKPNWVWSTGTWVNMITGKTHFINYHARIADKEVKKMREVQQYPTAILIKADILQTIKGFDEDIFMVYCDSSLCLKILHKGYKILYVPTAKVLHKEPVQVDGVNQLGAGSKVRAFLIGRNRIIFMNRYASWLGFVIFTVCFLPIYVTYYSWIFIKNKQFPILLAFLKGTGYGLLHCIGARENIGSVLSNL